MVPDRVHVPTPLLCLPGYQRKYLQIPFGSVSQRCKWRVLGDFDVYCFCVKVKLARVCLHGTLSQWRAGDMRLRYDRIRVQRSVPARGSGVAPSTSLNDANVILNVANTLCLQQFVVIAIEFDSKVKRPAYFLVFYVGFKGLVTRIYLSKHYV